MSVLILSPETVWNQGILKFSTAPRKILQRGMVFPRKEASARLRFRIILESQFVRYFLTLVPFIAAGITWPELALPLGSAPVLMLIAVGFVELRILRLPAAKRKDVVGEAESAHALDTLNFRGRKILSSLAAKRGIQTGNLFLVVEQSDLVRLNPLTFVSLQKDEGKSRLVALNKEEREMIRTGLFDPDFTEQDLALANQREATFLRSVNFEARGVSAHARLAAFLDNAKDTMEPAK
ncbi:hypothetical protein SAMN05444003_2838 [Cognatiyoonia sediminum]|uniref:Uncharacterized protein n=1 Tax=Cognatiyoonia sediminum TaxID=1508389 RepID=A0A1M5S473_9RHOB|nr:hypothetical protein SAMN05444003_2838 [Cognatiyoonia sediminum]